MSFVLQVGDKVTVNISDENWSWGYRLFPKQKGTKAVVRGFGEIHYSRTNNHGREPGIYENTSWAYLEGHKNSISSYFLDLDKRTEARRIKSGKFRDSKYLRPLPKMPFWEDDIVSSKVTCWEGVKEFVIDGIDYDMIGQKRNDGSPMPEYRIRPVTVSGGYTSVNGYDLTLIRRGNVWKFYNGEKPVFASTKEEAFFFARLGHTDQIRNPVSGLFAWTKQELLEAIKGGTVDCPTVHTLFNPLDNGGLNAWRFRDRELGERVRKLCIEVY